MIFQFNTVLPVTVQRVGGKAKALIDLTNAGFKIPYGIVLSDDFF